MKAGYVAACLLLMLVVAGVQAGTAAADAGIKISTFQAGAHPDTDLHFSYSDAGHGETLKRVTFNPEIGFAMEPASITTCLKSTFEEDECSPLTQLGVVTVRGEYESDSKHLFGTFPVYELTATASQFLRIGFTIATADGDLPVEGVGSLPSKAQLQTSPYQLQLTLDQLPQSPPLTAFDFALWGIPAASGHDASRFPKGSPGAPPGCPGSETTSCNVGPVASSLPQRPFTVNLADCHIWNSSATFATYQGAEFLDGSVNPNEVNGCEGLAFAPTVTATPTTTAGFSPSGLKIEIQDPQPGDPTALSPSELRKSTVITHDLELDPTVWEHPTCGIGGSCSGAAAIGTVRFEIAGLSNPVQGTAFLEKVSNGELHLLVNAAGSGVEFNQVATVAALSLERLRFGFAEQPRIPIVAEKFEFSKPPASIFRTPVHCGDRAVDAEVIPWYSTPPAVTLHSTYSISTGPAGAACIGAPTTLSVQLDPTTIAADGSSQTQATITVRDAAGNGVPGEEVHLRSSDPLQKLGPLVDNGNGTYSALITGSTTPAPATITATDFTPDPDLTGSATLLQTAGSGARQEQPPAAPPTAAGQTPHVAFSAKPRRKGTARRPRFDFSADVTGATFSCKIDQRAFKPCAPPVVLPKLSLGSHTFSVRAVAGNVSGPPASWRFKIVHKKRARHKAQR